MISRKETLSNFKLRYREFKASCKAHESTPIKLL